MDPIIDKDLYGENSKEVVYANFGARLNALIIDGLVILPITLPLTFVNILYWKSQSLFVLGSLLGLIYKPLCEYLWSTTAGKKIVGLRVLTYDLERINLFEALLRNIFRLVTGVLTLLVTLPMFQMQEFQNIKTVVDYSTFMSQIDVLSRMNLVLFPVMVAEVILLVSDFRRRSLHDRIARTVVVKESKIPL